MGNALSKVPRQLALGCTLVAFTTAVYSADGNTGFTSVGKLGISFTVPEEVKISNVVDIPLEIFDGADVSGRSPACVYVYGPAGLYNITGIGSGVNSAFTITDGTNTVAYGVEFDDGGGFSSLALGTALPSANGTSVDDDCAAVGSNNAAIRVTVPAATASALPAATYLGTLTLLVAPL